MAQSEQKGVHAIPNSFSYRHDDEELSCILNLHRLSFVLLIPPFKTHVHIAYLYAQSGANSRSSFYVILP